MFRFWTFLVLTSPFISSSAYGLYYELPKQHVQRTETGIHLPIQRRTAPIYKRDTTGSIGLGNFIDATYNVLVNVGGVSIPVVLDTGSSDLWVISDACKTCSKTIPQYPVSKGTFQPVGLDVRLLYGDSRTGTHAFGMIGKDAINLAGLSLQNQYFAAINDTNTTVSDTGSAGIMGLGFPVNSVIWKTALIHDRGSPSLKSTKREIAGAQDLARASFPNISELFQRSHYQARQSSTSISDIFASYATTAPLLGRLVTTQGLAMPMFTVTLQRDTVDVGGNVGLLSIGELPYGIKNETLTWVPLRAYNTLQGGLPPPPDSPHEEYPITWEIYIDDVYLDGEKLPRSSLSPPSIALSALVDTGNSLIRGPSDVIQLILAKLGNQLPCSEPHTLSFQIGGKMFPVDPRDFVNQAFINSVDVCAPNLAPTDPPAVGQYLYSWSLGDPFLKSVLSSYYYGNLTYPSRDPPKIGLLSTVPSDAKDRMKAAVDVAAKNGGNFPALSEAAPTGTPSIAATNFNGVPEATPTTTTSGPKSNAASRSAPVVWLLGSTVILIASGAALS